MSKVSWKNEEKRVACIMSGSVVPLSRPFDVDTAKFVVEVKYRHAVGVSECLRDLKKLDKIAMKCGKLGLLVVRKKNIPDTKYARMVCMLVNDFLEVIKNGNKELLFKILQVQ